MAAQRSIAFIVILLLLHHRAECLLLGQWRTAISLSQSLMSRVANARAARGDRAGANRARGIADKIDRFGGGRWIWSAGWDFARNYAFRGGIPSYDETYRSASEIMELLSEFHRLKSAERAKWMSRKYSLLMDRSKSFFRILLRSFSRSGFLREVVLVMQKEVVEGELLRDCLEVGAADLVGLVRIAKDVILSSTESHSEL